MICGYAHWENIELQIVHFSILMTWSLPKTSSKFSAKLTECVPLFLCGNSLIAFQIDSVQ